MTFTPRNKVQKLAYEKWGVEDAEAFAAKVAKRIKRGTARTMWLAGSPNHLPDQLKAAADLLGTTIDDLFYKAQ